VPEIEIKDGIKCRECVCVGSINCMC